jgi:hypothetical protein
MLKEFCDNCGDEVRGSQGYDVGWCGRNTHDTPGQEDLPTNVVLCDGCFPDRDGETDAGFAVKLIKSILQSKQ